MTSRLSGLHPEPPRPPPRPRPPLRPRPRLRARARAPGWLQRSPERPDHRSRSLPRARSRRRLPVQTARHRAGALAASRRRRRRGGAGDPAGPFFLRLRHRGFFGDRLAAGHHEVAKDRVVEAEARFQLIEHRLAALDVHQHVVGLVYLLDGKGELAAAPVLEPVDLAAVGFDDRPVTIHHRANLLALVRVDQKHDLVVTHEASFRIAGLARARISRHASRWRQGVEARYRSAWRGPDSNPNLIQGARQKSDLSRKAGKVAGKLAYNSYVRLRGPMPCRSLRTTTPSSSVEMRSAKPWPASGIFAQAR